MKGRMKVFTICIMVVALAGAFAVRALAQENQGDDGTVTLVGTVVAADWDEQGNVIGVDLQTDEQDYIIADTGSGVEILHLVGKKISATGTVTQNEDGVSILTVSSFKVLDDEPSE